MYYLFLGSSHIKQYGLPKETNKAMFVMEAYPTQMMKNMEEVLVFVVYDNKVGKKFYCTG